MNLVLRQMCTRQTFRLCDGIRSIKLTPVRLPMITSSSAVQVRNYSDSKPDARTLPQLMDFPLIVWPSFIKFIKNWMFANLIIRPYFENDFNLNEFIQASKQAVQIVSECLQNGDFQTLEGLVEKDAISSLKTSVSKLSVSQRQQLAIDKDDICYAFPYQIGVMFDEADKRWVEITMCYHVLKGMKDMVEKGETTLMSLSVQPDYQDRIFVLNYRFIREFTKGVEDSWWVNIVNHFQPHSLLKR